MKYWEIIADNLSKAGWSWGVSSGFTREGKRIFIADAHKDDGKRYISRADEILTAFLQLECALPKTEKAAEPLRPLLRQL
jgi:hypothetical protein